MSRWPMVPLGEVLTQYKEYIDPPEPRPYSKLSVKLYGKGVTLDALVDGQTLKMKRHQVAKAGQVILSEIWGKKGAIGFVPREGAGALCTSHFFLFDVRCELLDPRWLDWIFKANYLESQLGAEAKGTTGYAAVRPTHLLNAVIPLPPLAEQGRIVEQIDMLAAKIEECTRLRAEATREQHALLISAVSKNIEALGLTGTLMDVLLGRPRNGWSVKCDGADNGVAVLGLGAITGFRYRPDQAKRTSEPTNPNAHYWLKRGDLLISRSNTPALVGHAAIYNGTPTPCIYPDLMMRVPLDQQVVEPRFVHYVLQSRAAREFIKAHAKGTRPTMKKISQRVVESIPFPSHCTRSEQEAVIARLDEVTESVDRAQTCQTAATTKLSALLPSVLNKAFSGEL